MGFRDFCCNMDFGHTVTHTARLEFESSNNDSNQNSEIGKFEKFTRVEPNFRFIHYWFQPFQVVDFIEKKILLYIYPSVKNDF